MKYHSDLLCKSIFNLARTRPNFYNLFSHIKGVKTFHFQRDGNLFISKAKFHSFSDYSDSLSTNFNDNVTKLTDYDQYHKVVYRPLDTDTVSMNDLVVSVFFNKQSTASMSVLESVKSLSLTFPNNKFLLIDSDLVPRSAYDADVQHFPSALLSYGGDLYRDMVSVEPGFRKDRKSSYTWSFSAESGPSNENYECVLPKKFYESVVNSMNKFSLYDGRKLSSIKSKAGTHSYTHGIDTDNLNLKRVGWPTE